MDGSITGRHTTVDVQVARLQSVDRRRGNTSSTACRRRRRVFPVTPVPPPFRLAAHLTVGNSYGWDLQFMSGRCAADLGSRSSPVTTRHARRLPARVLQATRAGIARHHCAAHQHQGQQPHFASLFREPISRRMHRCRANHLDLRRRGGAEAVEIGGGTAVCSPMGAGRAQVPRSSRLLPWARTPHTDTAEFPSTPIAAARAGADLVLRVEETGRVLTDIVAGAPSPRIAAGKTLDELVEPVESGGSGGSRGHRGRRRRTAQ